MPRLRARVLRPAFAVVALAALACDLPTSLPTWNTTWEVPVQSATLSVAELLPDIVRLDESRSAFLFSGDPVTTSRSLGAACGECAAANGATVPKPAFTLDVTAATSLPERIDSAQLVDGRVTVRVTNGLAFDPLRPGAAERGGWLTVGITSGGREIARQTLQGADWALPANGGELTLRLPLAAGRVVRGVDVNLTIHSPRGDAVRIDTAQRVSVIAVIDSMRIGSATLAVRDEPIGSTPVAVDVDAVPASAIDRIEGGALHLDIENPFSVSSTTVGGEGTRAIVIADGQTFSKPLALAPGANAVVLDFTADELRTILRSSAVAFEIRGFVSAVDGTTVSPTQQIGIDSRLRLTLRTTER